MIYDRSQFSPNEELPSRGVEMSIRTTAQVKGKGNIPVEMKVDNKRQMCILKYVLDVTFLGY